MPHLLSFNEVDINVLTLKLVKWLCSRPIANCGKEMLHEKLLTVLLTENSSGGRDVAIHATDKLIINATLVSVYQDIR